MMKKLLFTIFGTVILQFAYAQVGSGNCLDFDGVDDYVDCGNNASLNTDNGTIELWFMLNSTINSGNASLQTLISKNISGANPGDMYLWWHNSRNKGQLEFGFEQTGGTKSTIHAISNSWAPNEWHHVAITWIKNGAMKMYIDGVDQGNSTTTNVGLHSSSQNLKIATETVNNGYIDAVIDEVRIWNRALAQTEIRDSMSKTLIGNETGLVGYWNMNEGTGSTITDLTSNGNDGTLQ